MTWMLGDRGDTSMKTKLEGKSMNIPNDTEAFNKYSCLELRTSF